MSAEPGTKIEPIMSAACPPIVHVFLAAIWRTASRRGADSTAALPISGSEIVFRTPPATVFAMDSQRRQQ